MVERALGERVVEDQPPTGMVTFLVTDIQGSTALARYIGEEAYHEVLERHHRLLLQEFARYKGYAFSDTGDGFWAAFGEAEDGLACAIACQRALAAEHWPRGPDGTAVLRIRMAIHVAEALAKDGNYRGIGLHDLSRILSAGHGGQILLSQTAKALLSETLPPDVELLDLGQFRLRDAPGPQRLFQVLYPDMPQRSFAPLRAPRLHTPQLPPLQNRLIGRTEEIDNLRRLLTDPDVPLVTIVGSGGTGKTKLAIEAARSLTDVLSGAMWFVPLVDISDPLLIGENIHRALGLESVEESGQLDQVIAALSEQPSLLVLDNFDHLVAGGAPLVQNLLQRAPILKCLVTSRQRLGLSMETEFELLPLPAPAAAAAPEILQNNPSVQLFIERAQRSRSDFRLTERNARAVAELCSRLEGVPLAIELAAAWAKVLAPAQMLSQLKGILISQDQELVNRHRSLALAMEASYRLLSSELQSFFARLSVFRGGWTIESAKAVCEETRVLDSLWLLRERSLILTEETASEIRYRMLETLREYAGERLKERPGEEAATLSRRQEFFAALALEADQKLQGPEQGEWLECLEEEHQNVRAVLAWASEQTRLQMAARLHRFWMVRGHVNEGRRWLESVISTTPSEVPVEILSRALSVGGALALAAGDLSSARSHWQRRLSLLKETRDERGIALTLVNLAITFSQEGDFKEARARYEEGLQVLQSLGDSRLIAITLSNLGALANQQKDYPAARSYLEESLAIQESMEDPLLQVNTLQNLAGVQSGLGDYPAALHSLNRCLKIRLNLGDRSAVGHLVEVLAFFLLRQDQLQAAARFYAAAGVIRDETETPRSPADQDSIQGEIELLRDQMDPQDFHAAWDAGQAMTWDQIVASAMEAAGEMGDQSSVISNQ